METKYGFPIVNADNIFSIISELGIKRWCHLRPPKDLREYANSGLSPDEKKEMSRFAPKAEVVFLEDPDGNEFRGFRAILKDWVTVFALLPGDLVPITAEYKHGSEDIIIVPPCGTLSDRDFHDLEETDPLKACAKREFREETGFALAEVIPLYGLAGYALSPRQSIQRYFPFLGKLKLPQVQDKQNLDATERLKVLLLPLPELLKLIDYKMIVDECAISCTFLALRKLGRI